MIKMKGLFCVLSFAFISQIFATGSRQVTQFNCTSDVLAPLGSNFTKLAQLHSFGFSIKDDKHAPAVNQTLVSGETYHGEYLQF